MPFIADSAARHREAAPSLAPAKDKDALTF